MAKSKKNPFRGYSVKDVLFSEANCWVVQAGEDLIAEGGQLAFTKMEAQSIHDKLRNGFNHLIRNGSKNEKKEALICLLSLKIMPLRIH